MAKKLTRSTDDRWISGVCGGIAQYAGVDANLVRLVVAAATILGFGSLAAVYVLAWVLMPKQELPPGARTIVHEPPPPSA